jgi:hypothetical protein
MPTRTPKKKTTEKPTRAKTTRARTSSSANNRLSTQDEDILPRGAAGQGAVFGRCGGRPIHSSLEREVCDRLTDLGVAHSHRPRHFEVRFDEGELAAYAPTIVLRGRGREGKTVVVETAEASDHPGVRKIRAFRDQYGAEFYVCFVAPEQVLDVIHFATYDEAANTTAIHTLVNRLAD